MRTSTTIVVLLAACLPFAGVASAAPSDPARTVCGAWVTPQAAAGCGTVAVSWTAPVCTGSGSSYQCTVQFTERLDLLGSGCILSDVDQYGSGYGGLCSTGGARATIGPVSVTYAGIPAGGSVVTVTATACFSADSGTPLQPVPGSSACETWVVGDIALPGEPGP